VGQEGVDELLHSLPSHPLRDVSLPAQFAAEGQKTLTLADTLELILLRFTSSKA